MQVPPHPTIPLKGREIAGKDALEEEGITTFGDLQLLSESDLHAVEGIDARTAEEIKQILHDHDCRLRHESEPLHRRARQVFLGTGTGEISVIHLHPAIGKSRAWSLRSQNVGKAGALARLSREEIDRLCGDDVGAPLTDEEFEQLQETLRNLGLASRP